MYPIDLDGTIDLSSKLDLSLEGKYSEMLNRKSKIILSTTAIILYPISELIKMNMSLHMVQI